MSKKTIPPVQNPAPSDPTPTTPPEEHYATISTPRRIPITISTTASAHGALSFETRLRDTADFQVLAKAVHDLIAFSRVQHLHNSGCDYCIKLDEIDKALRKMVVF